MNKTLIILGTVFLVLVLVFLSFAGGVLAGYAMPRTGSIANFFDNNAKATPQPALPGATDGTQVTAAPVKDRDALFKPFWEAWDLMHENYVDQPLDDVTLMRGAISGMMNSMGDPNTGYMDPDQYEQANAPLEGEYDGIGAWVEATGDYLPITSPMKVSPAEKAGLKSGDKIIKLNGVDQTGIDPSVTLKSVLGKAGTDVTLTIVRDGETEPFDVTITRAKIVVPLVESKMLDNNIAYLNVMQFGDSTARDVKNQLNDLLKNNPRGLILDLRNDPGGYLTAAISVVSQFVDSGTTVMYEQYGNGDKIPYTAKSGGLATKIPLVVLINEGSASASEITAGAIQDLGRGKLVGVTSYGKGTVQSWIPLKDNAGAVKITIARWLTPNGRTIHGEGLKPDVVVEMTEEDVKNERDPQLDKAIELLLNN